MRKLFLVSALFGVASWHQICNDYLINSVILLTIAIGFYLAAEKKRKEEENDLLSD